MLIYILSRSENLYSTKRLVAAGLEAGHDIKVYNHRAAAYFGLGEFVKSEADLIKVEQIKKNSTK